MPPQRRTWLAPWVARCCSAPAINAAIGTTYTVRVYQGSSSGVATTFPQAPNPPLPNPGTFTLSPLPAGNYQLVVAADNANTAGGTGAASARTADIAVGEAAGAPGCAASMCARG